VRTGACFKVFANVCEIGVLKLPRKLILPTHSICQPAQGETGFVRAPRAQARRIETISLENQRNDVLFLGNVTKNTKPRAFRQNIHKLGNCFQSPLEVTSSASQRYVIFDTVSDRGASGKYLRMLILFANSKKSAMLGCRAQIHESGTSISYGPPRKILSLKRDTAPLEDANRKNLSINRIKNMMKGLDFTE